LHTSGSIRWQSPVIAEIAEIRLSGVMAATEPFKAAVIPGEFSPDDPHLIGVSGGRDSVALLHWLVQRGFRRLIVCHLDHGLRSTSDSDARFTEDLARSLGVECVTNAVDARAVAAEAKLSLEAAAREMRYGFFAEVAAARGCPRVFLAHHADDQVETFLLQLLRGAGASGLGGMPTLSMRPIGRVELSIARPFLGVWRAEIDGYVADHALRFCEDETNAELHHTRNRIRHLALPALREAFGRDPREALWRAAELIRAEDDLLAAAPELRDLPAELDVSWLRGLPLALQRRVLHRWMRRGGVADVGFEEVEAARSLLAGGTAKVNLPGGKCARRREKRLFLDEQ
jgi:tRNA(Ile)-lysidine synthase